MKKILFLFFCFSAALIFAQAKAKRPPASIVKLLRKKFTDSCFYPGNVIETKLGNGKDSISLDSLRNIGRLLATHKNSRIRIVIYNLVSVSKKHVKGMKEFLYREFAIDSGRFCFELNPPPATAAGKPYFFFTTIWFLERTPFPYKKPPKEKTETNFRPGDIVEMPELLYDLSMGRLRPETKDSLKIWAKFINEHPEFIFEVANHTDGRGSDKSNMTISYWRSKNSYDFLVNELKVPKERIYYKGYSESQFLVPESEIKKKKTKDEVEMDHQKNRRTELRIIAYSGDPCYIYK